MYSKAELFQGMVNFSHYESGELWYIHENTKFIFPVPITDTGDGIFLDKDKAAFFMRWMRKHSEMLEAAEKEQT